MDASAQNSYSLVAPCGPLKATIRALGSLKLAVPLLALLAAVIATASILEADRGREFAQWYVYRSHWFVALLGLLGLNIFFAAASRWPWKRHQTGFVITHCGLLILLAGAVRSFLGSVEGQVRLAEGQTVTKMTIPSQSQITTALTRRPAEAPYRFVFDGGPVSWWAGKTLDLGEIDGVRARVLRYYRHARVKEEWVTDATGTGGPSVRFKVEGPQGSTTGEQLLVDQQYGDETSFGPIRVQLQRAANAAMLSDFQKPPKDCGGAKGLLIAYFKDQSLRISVDEALGRQVALDDSGLAVEIAGYLPNARPDPRGGFQTAGESPTNPILELNVIVPGAEQPLRQLASARNPLLTLDPVYGQDCPVKFRYYHSGTKPVTGVELMQDNGGRLHGSVGAVGRLTPLGKLTAGSRIDMPGGYVIAITEHRPHVRSDISFEPMDPAANQRERAEAAAEIEVTAAGVTRTVWLQRNHPELGTHVMSIPNGPLRIRFSEAERPLGFSLKLLSFRRAMNPGGVGDASFSSTVLVADEARGVEREHTIAMNRPLTHNQMTFYQSGFEDSGHGPISSTLSVGRDPGRTLKYGGGLLICVGIGIMFYMRAYFFKKQPMASKAQRRFERQCYEQPDPAGV